MLKVENLTVSFNDDIGNGIIVDNFSFELNKNISKMFSKSLKTTKKTKPVNY